MEIMAEGVYVIDPEGRVVSMNSPAARMLGWSEDELRGKPAHRTIHHQRPDGTPFPEEECELLKVRTRRRTVRMSNDAFVRKDGSVFPVSYCAAPLSDGSGSRSENGSASAVVVVFHDTTEEVTAQSRADRGHAAHTWVGRIREALDDDRFVLYAQPIVSVDGQRHSEELLLRMIGREGEVIAPGAFLPAAETSGLIWEIDQWVVQQAIRLAASGRRVEVNLSADSISNLDLLAFIERALERSGADPANIVFELTETALMGDLEEGRAFAIGLNEIGCGLALDDFGTGFGSFTYLKTLPISYLKIDIDFVRDLVTNTANQHLVKAIVSLAKAFGQQTIAEGVEDARTLSLLRDYGVDYVQGFHLGRPVPCEDVVAGHS
jgi:PAS domain S-box-containing protein